MKETLSAMLVIVIAGSLMLIIPSTILIAPVLISVFLLFVLGAQGWQGFLMTLAAGLIPFIVLGVGFNGLTMVLPILPITVALYWIVRSGRGFPTALGALSLASILGISLTLYFTIYIISGSDLVWFTGEMAKTMQQGILAIGEGRGYELPPSQLQLIKEAADSITPGFIQDLLPGTGIALGLTQGYLVLRFARRYLKKFTEFKEIQVPLISRIRISPFLLLLFLVMAGFGMIIGENDQRIASILFSTGSIMVSFLGAVGAMSLIWNFAEAGIRMRHPFNRALFTLVTLYFFSGTWMIVLTIADSILDFRNTSGTSIYRWLRYKLFESKKEEN